MASIGPAERQSAQQGRSPIRILLHQNTWWRWNATTGLARLPVAMLPLAFVLAGRSATGSFAVGSLLAGVEAITSALGAPVAGQILDRWNLRAGLRISLFSEAVIITLLALAVGFRLSLPILLLLSVLLGVVPSGVEGGLRAFLPFIVSEDELETAFTLDATLLEVEWMAAPLIVALIMAYRGSVSTLAFMACCAAVASLSCWVLPAQPSHQTHEIAVQGGLSTDSLLQVWSPTFPIFVLSAAMGLAEGTVVVALAPLMTLLHEPAPLAGMFAGLLSVASALGGIIYGARAGRWPGEAKQRANLLLILLGALFFPLVVTSSVLLAIISIALAGLMIAPLNALRSHILQQVVPPGRRAQGFALLSAIMGIGYGGGGLLNAVLLDPVGVRGVLTVAVIVPVLGGTIALYRERFASRQPQSRWNGGATVEVSDLANISGPHSSDLIEQQGLE